MQFLKTLFWVVVAVIAVVFGANNWTPVSIRLWSDIQLETMLPVLMLGAFLAGLIPLLLWHRASKWTLQRRLGKVEAALAQEQAYRLPESSGSATSNLAPAPSSAPMAVPPGVA